MYVLKQILRLLGGSFLLIASLAIPTMTCVQKMSTHRETEAVITEVKDIKGSGRRGRTTHTYRVHYAYTVDGNEYRGYGGNYEASASTRPGDKLKVVYNKNNPSDSHVSEGGGQPWTMTFGFLAISAYLFWSFNRNRRLKMAA